MNKTLLSLFAVAALTLGACAHDPNPNRVVAPQASDVVGTPAPAPVAHEDQATPKTEEKSQSDDKSADDKSADDKSTDDNSTDDQANTHIVGDGWSMDVPAEGWVKLRTTSPEVVALLNPAVGNLVMVVVEDTDRTTAAQREHVLSEMNKNHQGNPITIVAHSKKMVVNKGMHFATVALVSGNIHGWIWSFVSNGKAYNLLCSGKEDTADGNVQQQVCQAMFESLTIGTQQ